jgi:MFS family permease
MWFHIISFLIYGITQIFIGHVETFLQLSILISILGVCDGIYLCFLLPIVCEIAGSPKLANQAVGYYHSLIAIPVIAGPTLSAYIYEKIGGYKFAFYLGGICCILCSIILLYYPALFKDCKNKKNKNKK